MGEQESFKLRLTAFDSRAPHELKKEKMTDKTKRIIKCILAYFGIMILTIIAGVIVFIPINLGLIAIFGVFPKFVSFIIGFVIGFSLNQLFLNLFKL